MTDPQSFAVKKERAGKFVKRFISEDKDISCPGFYELVLSNGCNFGCAYCYLMGTLRGQKHVNLYINDWSKIVKELENKPTGIFNTGELGDSLALEPPLLGQALDWFSSQEGRYLLLVTKSVNIAPLLKRTPNKNIIVSFSVNTHTAWSNWEKGAPNPHVRLDVADELIKRGWRVRIRLDHMIGLFPDTLPFEYSALCENIAAIKPERVTLGSLRPYGPVYARMQAELKEDLERGPDGRWRYPQAWRVAAYGQAAKYLGARPGPCKKTKAVWTALGWNLTGCNCTV